MFTHRHAVNRAGSGRDPVAGCGRLRAMTRLRTALVAGALLLAGCGDDDGDQPATTGPGIPPPAGTPAATATAQSGPTEPSDALDGAGTDPVVVAAANTETALLSDVRAAAHDGYDRVAFEFENSLPGYAVRYVDRPVRQDGSGDVVEVDGEVVLQVRMENALDADLSKPSAPRTYDGPSRLSPGTPQVVEVVRVGGFEGILTWVVGLRDRADFRVTTLDEPPRLVLDVRS
jgi:hypothetical protein